MASYGGRSPVGQRPVSTKVEGAGVCLMADVCPYHVLSGHTAIASHGHWLWGSVVSYGGRCRVVQWPEWRGGTCLTAGICPDPENYPAPMGVPVNPGDGSTPMRESHDPVR